MTFAELASDWLSECARTRRPKTLENYRGTVARFLEHVPELHQRAATRRDLIAFRDARADAVSVLTANRDLKALKACLNWGEAGEYPHPRVPMKKLLLPLPARKDSTFQPGEIDRIMRAAALDVPVLVVLKVAHATGFRLGEILHLEWRDVDASAGSVSVSAKPERSWRPKTDAALRTVFAPALVAWLGEYRQTLRHRGERDLVAQHDVRRGTGWSNRIHTRMRDVLDRAGVAKGKRPTHGFRHTAASDLVQSGCPIHVAQKALGHASASVTLAVYSHAQRAGLEQAGAALEQYRAARSPEGQGYPRGAS